jgi:uncharacterized protein YdeI (YjbR/CyaY-like superfamily)
VVFTIRRKLFRTVTAYEMNIAERSHMPRKSTDLVKHKANAGEAGWYATPQGRLQTKREYTEERPVEMPAELEHALAEVKPLRRWFDQLNPSARHDLCRYVAGVKSPEARQRRAEQQVERMLATMEAERDLPPALRLAFARDPLAWRGWHRMSPRQRRVQLFGVFYYRTPEGQERRIGKLMEDARGRVKKGAGAAEQQALK